MGKLKILVLSYYFPPAASPQSIQVSRLISNLDASVVVVCGDNNLDRKDETITPGIESSLEYLIRVPFSRDKLTIFFDKIGNRLNFAWYDLPDMQRRWIKRAYEDFRKWQKRSGFRPDIVITFGMPMSGHLFGMKYKRQTGTSWVAHFSDPWADNMRFDGKPLIKRLNRRIEGKAIAQADKIIFTSHETIDLVMEKYPVAWREKVFYLPHSYDKTAFDISVEPDDKSYVIRSLGSFYYPRSPKPFFEAIETIAKERPALLDDVIIELVGQMGIYKDLLSGYPYAQRFIQVAGVVPYAESLRLMQTAHCLLVIDAPAKLSVFFPSKLVEYIGANRFIFAISPKGATDRIVREVGGMVADPSNVDSIIDALENILRFRPKNLPLPDNRYERAVVAEEFMKVVEMSTKR